MLLRIEPSEALVLIGSARSFHKETVVPAQFAPCDNSPYADGYDWLFVYERRIAAILERWLRPYRYELIGEKGLLCEALSNAFCHGHGKDPHKPIMVWVILGEVGLLIRIRDSGPGFNVDAVFERYLNSQTYFTTAGNGLYRMATSPHFGIFYDATGTAFHLLYFFPHSSRKLENLATVRCHPPKPLKIG